MAESVPDTSRTPLPAWIHAVAIAGVAGACWAIFSRAFLNYDTLYTLIWGRDAIHGRVPDYEQTLAPTPHPLAEAVGGLASLLGTDPAYTAMLAIAMLAFGALVWGVLLLGRECFNWPVGLVAAAVVATSVPFLSYGMRAYVDIPFLALVVFAALLEVRRPRRGVAVLVLLALAGLLRPEAWLLAAAYWVYLRPSLDRRGQVQAAALVLLAPLIWILSDLAVSGDALHSLLSTRDTSETLGRPRGILKVPEVLPRRLGEIVRIVPLIGGAIGFGLGLGYLRRRSMVPAALALLGGLGFLVLGIAGLSLLGRYLFLPAAMVAIFFGVACFGWLLLERRSARRNWTIFGVVATLVFVSSSIAHQTPRLADLRDGIQYRGAVEDDLRELAAVNRLAQLSLEDCPTIYVPNHRPVPILAWQLDRAPGDFATGVPARNEAGALILPANARAREKFILDRNDPAQIDVPLNPGAGWRLIASNESWRLFVGPTPAPC